MKTITSIKHAIEYFRENSTHKITKDISGRTYNTIIPPADFRLLVVTKSDGWSTIYYRTNWADYTKVLTDQTITKIRLTIEN